MDFLFIPIFQKVVGGLFRVCKKGCCLSKIDFVRIRCIKDGRIKMFHRQLIDMAEYLIGDISENGIVCANSIIVDPFTSDIGKIFNRERLPIQLLTHCFFKKKVSFELGEWGLRALKRDT